jgi:hypothetical protein
LDGVWTNDTTKQNYLQENIMIPMTEIQMMMNAMWPLLIAPIGVLIYVVYKFNK